MRKELLIRDLKLNQIIEVMADGSSQLTDLCRRVLVQGYDSVEKINNAQKRMQMMLRSEAETKEIYRITCSVYEKIHPYKNCLLPQMVTALSPQKKLNIHLHICILIGEGLLSVYEIQKEEEKKKHTGDQITELKALLVNTEESEYRLSGKFGSALRLSGIRMTEPEKHRQQRRSWFSTGSERICRGAAYLNLSGEADRFKTAVCYSLLRILGSYEKKIEKELLNIQQEYGYGTGAVNLRRSLQYSGAEICYPEFVNKNIILQTEELKDISLLLKEETVNGNEVNLEGGQLIIITGANQGGKTTFLRSVGQAQLMAQSGLFVMARTFQTEYHAGIFTHFPEEEAGQPGKGLLEADIQKMRWINNRIKENDMLLLNESFQNTSEQEGYRICMDVVNDFLTKNIKVFFVTHNYRFSSRLYEQGIRNAVFLRADKEERESRTFRIRSGSPERSAYAMTLYEQIIGE